MSKLCLIVKLGYDPLDIKRWFDEKREEGDEFVMCHRIMLIGNYELVYNIRNDVLSQEQYAWILTHMSFLKEAIFETDCVGLVGLTYGTFRMQMR